MKIQTPKKIVVAVAVVTGSSSGIGFETSSLLARNWLPSDKRPEDENLNCPQSTMNEPEVISLIAITEFVLLILTYLNR